MFLDKVVLCGASAYEKKYYLNEEFQALPKSIKDEIKIMCVLFTEEVGGVIALEFEEDGTLRFRVESKEADYMFDDIGSALKIKELQQTKYDLLESIELFYKVFVLGEDIDRPVDKP